MVDCDVDYFRLETALLDAKIIDLPGGIGRSCGSQAGSRHHNLKVSFTSSIDRNYFSIVVAR